MQDAKGGTTKKTTRRSQKIKRTITPLKLVTYHFSEFKPTKYKRNCIFRHQSKGREPC